MATKAQQNIRKGSKVQFKVGRGKLIGKIVAITDGVAAVKSDSDGRMVSRKLELLRAASA